MEPLPNDIVQELLQRLKFEDGAVSRFSLVNSIWRKRALKSVDSIRLANDDEISPHKFVKNCSSLQNLQRVFLPDGQEPVIRPNEEFRALLQLNATHLQTIINVELCELQNLNFPVLHELAFDWSSGFPDLEIPVCPSVKVLAIRKIDSDGLNLSEMFKRLGQTFPEVEVFSFLLKYGFPTLRDSTALRQYFPKMRLFSYVGDILDTFCANAGFGSVFSPPYCHTHLAARLQQAWMEDDDNTLLSQLHKQPVGASDWALHDPDLYPIAFMTPLQFVLITRFLDPKKQESDARRMRALMLAPPQPGFRATLSCLHLRTPRSADFQEIFKDGIYLDTYVKEGHNFFTLAFAVPSPGRISFVLDVYFSDEYEPYFTALSFEERRRLFFCRKGLSASQLLGQVGMPIIEEKLSARDQSCPRVILLRELFPLPAAQSDLEPRDLEGTKT